MSGARPKDPRRHPVLYNISRRIHKTQDDSQQRWLKHRKDFRRPYRPTRNRRGRGNFKHTRTTRGRGSYHGTDVWSSLNGPNENVTKRRQAATQEYLTSILEAKSKNDVVTTLSKSTYAAEDITDLVNAKKLGDDVTEVLLQIYVKVFQCKLSDSRKKMIDIIKSSNFSKKVLISYATNIGDRFKKSNRKENEMCIKLVWSFLQGMMSSEYEEINDLALITTILDIQSKELFEKQKLTQNALIAVARFKKESDKYVSDVKEAEKKNRQRESAKREGICDGPPPNDYRDIPILPTTYDVHSTEPPFLRPNISKGSYASQYHYLDVQFRLLREDFICPLREGIQTHLDSLANPLPRNQRKRNTDVRLYYDVKIINPVFSQREEGVLHRVHFSLNNLKYVKWKNTKRLMFGSLVCLSHDNFQTLLFGTICTREDCYKGRVDIKFHALTNTEIARIYTMVESTAFFENYRAVLQVLQQFDDVNCIPMDRYIIQASHDIRRPKYLLNKTRMKYDISPLVKADVQTNKIDILDENAWPEIDKLVLDESQISAVKSALTDELAVIQGPPGTGKTYIGLKVVETLLINKHQWAMNNLGEDSGSDAIMVICYTNHALDQFLEGILPFCDNLVRIGGRSKSTKLEQYNLKELIRRMNRRTRHDFQRIEELADFVSRKMIAGEEMMKLCDKYIVSEFTLENIIDSRHLECLRDSREEYGVDGHRSTLPMWLGLLSVSDNYTNVDVLIDDDKQDDDENNKGNTNITTEFDRILDQRDYDDVRAKQDYESKKNTIITDLSSKLAYDPKMQCKDAPLERHRATVRKQLSIVDDEMSEHEASRVNIRKLSVHDRWRLYRYWIGKYKCQLRQNLFEQQHSYDEMLLSSVEQKNERKLNILQYANVIGITTTGAARNKGLLNEIRPRIVVVEEAAEILEAHIVTSLTKQCEHLILIGDHQQLKPNPTVYKLATKFNLDISMFERMLTNGVPCKKLSSQHRMRPEISQIMRKHFYGHLLDDESVKHFDNIRGVSHNMFFINHDIQEESMEDILSKSNIHEAEYCVALAKYLCYQGYDASSITILTTYTGQVLNFKRILRKESYACLRDIYVSSVDNYQGEENEIILLSFVRSNEAGNIGFLKVSNRMCVALSRAKKGLFCIGNFKLLAEKSDLWMKIVQDIKPLNCIGDYLELYCHNHRDTKVKVSSAEDFKQCPMGGCKRKCETRLECGHVCQWLCHPDSTHERYKCTEKCARLCANGHACRRKCFEDCTLCKVMVSRTLQCLHDIEIPCYQFETPVDCKEPCEMILKCGHECKNLCFKKCTSECLEIVTREISPCGHKTEVQCYITIMTCGLPCEKSLACGHACKERCGDTCTIKCTELIEKKFDCGHIVRVCCFTQTCPQPCSNFFQCGHKCKLKCYETCSRDTCTEVVIKKLRCGHEKELLCFDDPEQTFRKCHENVTKTLECGHQKELPCYVDPKYITYLEFYLRCNVEVTKLLECGHEQTINCWKSSGLYKTGCLENVEETLECGHKIRRICSESKLCNMKCSRLLPCRHYCKELCSQPCTKQCNVGVEKKLKCGHMKSVPCSLDVSEVMTSGEAAFAFNLVDEHEYCTKRCSRTLTCGHPCTNMCAEKCCNESCQQQCKQTLICGHVCQGKCIDCKDNLHKECTKCCNKKLICGHNCQQSCSIIPCQPCKKHCKSACWHKRCQRSCSDICEPCKAPCKWQCIHLKCTNLCNEFCNRKRCNQPCRKNLNCGHRCYGLCGEQCQSKCLVCDPASYYAAKYLPAEETRFIYVFLYDCDHAIEMDEMDEYMDKDEGIRLKQCLKCRKTIRFSPRYGNVLKTINRRIAEIKQKMHTERLLDRVQDMRRKIVSQLPSLGTNDQRRIQQEMNSRYGVKYERLLVLDIMIAMLRRVNMIRDLNQSDNATTYSMDIVKQVENIQERIWNSKNIASEQVVVDISSELQRLNICDQLIKLQLDSEHSDDINDLLSTLLHTKLPLIGEVMEEKLNLLEKGNQLKMNSGESLVNVAKGTVDRCLSFSHERWSTCRYGHVLQVNEIIKECKECSAPEKSNYVCLPIVNPFKVILKSEDGKCSQRRSASAHKQRHSQKRKSAENVTPTTDPSAKRQRTVVYSSVENKRGRDHTHTNLEAKYKQRKHRSTLGLWKLNCGHFSPFMDQRDLKRYKCIKDCRRVCERGHACSLKCFEDCPPCEVMIRKTLECQHKAKIQCGTTGSRVDCKKPCQRSLECSHECKNLCFEKCTSKCLEITAKQFSPCGHSLNVQCYIHFCQAPCETTLACGHECPNICGNFCENYKCKKNFNHHHDDGKHIISKAPCQKTLTCGHQCQRKCSEKCNNYIVAQKRLQRH